MSDTATTYSATVAVPTAAALALVLCASSCAQVLGIEEITPRGAGGAGGHSCTGGQGACPKELGETCQSSTECLSTHCADETCCSESCEDPCYRCDAASSVGAGQCAPGMPKCSCADQFDSELDFVPCIETSDDCGFSVAMSGGTDNCDALCRRHGGACFGAYLVESHPCGEGQSVGCADTGHGALFCVCSRGCGTGPRCPEGQVCAEGNCVP